MKHPVDIAKEWLEKETEVGSHYPSGGVLATVSPEGIPASRVVAIRELLNDGPIFFTQRKSNKVQHLSHQPKASLTLWLSQTVREVIFSGECFPLTAQENEHYWSLLPRDRQLKFTVHGLTSGDIIPSKEGLHTKFQELDKAYENSVIPHSKEYIGYQLVVDSVFFYTLRELGFSDVERFDKIENNWTKALISP